MSKIIEFPQTSELENKKAELEEKFRSKAEEEGNLELIDVLEYLGKQIDRNKAYLDDLMKNFSELAESRDLLDSLKLDELIIKDETEDKFEAEKKINRIESMFLKRFLDLEKEIKNARLALNESKSIYHQYLKFYLTNKFINK